MQNFLWPKRPERITVVVTRFLIDNKSYQQDKVNKFCWLIFRKEGTLEKLTDTQLIHLLNRVWQNIISFSIKTFLSFGTTFKTGYQFNTRRNKCVVPVMISVKNIWKYINYKVKAGLKKKQSWQSSRHLWWLRSHHQ